MTTVTKFRDNDDVGNVYHDEMKRLICRVTGADAAYVYKHLVRTETPTSFNDGYARFVHCDYNIKRLDGFAADLLGKHGVKPREN